MIKTTFSVINSTIWRKALLSSFHWWSNVGVRYRLINFVHHNKKESTLTASSIAQWRWERPFHVVWATRRHNLSHAKVETPPCRPLNNPQSELALPNLLCLYTLPDNCHVVKAIRRNKKKNSMPNNWSWNNVELKVPEISFFFQSSRI